MDKGQLLEREARWARPVGLASVVAVLLYVGSVVIEQSAGLVDNENDATQLLSYHEHSSALLGTAVMRMVGAVLLCAPLFYLFKAAEARSPRVRTSFIAFAFIGPSLIAAQAIVSWFGFDAVSQQFVDQADGALNVDLAKSLIDDNGTVQTAAALSIPAILGLMVAMVYIPLSAMRIGLLTRFYGTFAMALGVSLILLGPIALIVLLLWILSVGVMMGGWLPSGRPPAWAAGEAVPWPVPEKGSGMFGGGTRSQPPPDDAIEGSGRELEDELAAGDAETGPGDAEPGPGRDDDADTEIESTFEPPPEDALPGSQGERRKKRKRRS